jgi:hypothetical protein
MAVMAVAATRGNQRIGLCLVYHGVGQQHAEYFGQCKLVIPCVCLFHACIP